jgi:hypothetical protein
VVIPYDSHAYPIELAAEDVRAVGRARPEGAVRKTDAGGVSDVLAGVTGFQARGAETL